MAASWPPQLGELWMAAERWPATAIEAEVPGGAWVMILGGGAVIESTTRYPWWRGEVLGPHGVAWIKAEEGDLIPGDDPRFCAMLS